MPEKPRLLVVDDDAEITSLIGEIAVGEGWDVHSLNDSSSFSSSFDQIDPDLACIDIHMPDVDGIELLRWLANRGCRAGVIILSGGDPLFTKVAERIGEASNLAVRTLEKPFQLSEFRELLKKASEVGQTDAA